MIRNAIRLGRISGIEIGLDYSWFIIFAVATYLFATNVLPLAYPQFDEAAYWSTGVAISLLFFASILAHELGHSLVAIRKGTPVQSITLFIFGGVAGMTREPDRALHEFLIAIAGPLVSLGLAALFFGLFQIAPVNTPLAALTQFLAVINFAVAAFNMLPGFPMDGGRVLRAALWGLKGDLLWSTKIATWIGRGFAYAVMAWGAYMAIVWGQWGSGLWRILIATFIHTAAVRSYKQVAFMAKLRRRRVGEVMSPAPSTLPADLSVAEVVGNDLRWGSQPAWPVVENGTTLGLLTRDDLDAVPWEKRTRTSVADVLPTKWRTLMADVNDSLADVFQRLDGQRLIVATEADRVVGVITYQGLMQAVQAASEAGSRNRASI
ncbi:MAG: M50 family metallopeptidase [Candidatus Bipolaricaulia bacterium]